MPQTLSPINLAPPAGASAAVELSRMLTKEMNL